VGTSFGMGNCLDGNTLTANTMPKGMCCSI
jgi:hypothetical protein